MAIRKPSDYFNNENNSIEETIQDNAKNSELNTFSDAYNAFKRNLSKVDVLNNFSETLGNYQDNVEKVNYLSEKIDEIDEDIKNLLTKEDLDKALISQLLFLEECIRDVQEKVKGINHKNLTQVKLDISSLSETVNVFIDEEIPRYKKLVFESETRLTDKCEVLEDELKDTLDNIKVFIDEKYVEDFKSLNTEIDKIRTDEIPKYIEDFKSLNEEIDKIKTNDIPKYKNLIVDSEIKTDSKIKEFAEVFDNTVNDIVSKIELVKEDNTEIFDTLNSKVNEVNQIHNLMLNDIEKSENTRDELDKKIVDLEVEILRNESHIVSQNKNIEDIHGDVKSAIDRLNIGKIEENNFKLGEKIKYLEEVFEKFNEKELLSENIITEPSSTDNNDPLTPLDKNFVTLDQLQNHYRLFINRIQQQLASFGGGGEVRLEFLDDVDRDSAKVNGKFLKYDSASGKWVGANASGGAGSQTLDDTLGLGNTSSLGMSVGIVTSTKLHIDPVGSGVTFNEDLVVVGDARVTGILSIGTSSIVLDPNAKTISGVEELQVGETTIKNDSEGNITFVNTINPTQTINVGIGTTASVNTTGIITASSFTGSLIGTATNATNLNNQAASYYLNYNNFSNTPTALSSFSNDVGFVTSSVVAGYATEGFVNSAVAGIVSSAPATLDTLNELAQALDNDANFSTTVTNLIGTKASLSGATFVGIITGTLDGTASNATNLNNQSASYYLDYNNFSNTPTAYGDSDVDSHLNRTQQVSQNYVLSWDGQDYAWVAQSGGGAISNVVEDTTPQLGGNLDLNSKDITGTGNVNLTGVITATSLVRSGGTSSQFLKADGSVDSSTYLTSYTETDPVVAAINGIVKSNGTTISAATAGTDYLTDISQDTTPQLGGNLQTNSNDIIFADNDRAEFGNNGDFRILHNGTNTFLSNYFGDLIIGNYGVEYSGDDIIIESADDFEVRLNTGINSGTGTTAIYATGGGSVALNHNGSTKFETTASGIDVTGHTETDTLNVSGVSTFQSNVHLLDSVELRLGTGNDLKIYHDSNNSYISDQGTGNLKVLSSTFVLRNAADNAFMLQAVANSAVKLFHNNTNRLETTDAGVTITGIATATSFVKTGGTSSEYLMADGSVTTSGGGGGGGISNVVEDTTPQLGGNLDLNSKDITGTGNLNVSGIVTATQLNVNDVYNVEAESSSFTASAGVAYTANTYTASDFVNAEYTLFFQHSSGIQSQKVLVMDDGSTAYSQEYGIMSSNGLLVSVGATVKSNNVELLFTPETGVTGIVTYRFTRGTMI